MNLRELYADGYRSLAIVLVHSYTYPDHEKAIGSLARSLGFTHVSESASLLPMIKMVPRGVSSTADAYLTPILGDYLDGFFQGFDEKLKGGSLHGPRIEFMGSDGGLVEKFLGIEKYLEWPCRRCRGLCFDKLGREFEATNYWVGLFIYSLYCLMLIDAKAGCRRNIHRRIEIRWALSDCL